MKIQRERYLQKLITRKGNGLVKIITGIRRCGKSFLLFILFKEHLLSEGVDAQHLIEIQLDDDRSEELRDPRKLSEAIRERIPSDGKMTYVFIDEIQLCRKVLAKGVVLKDLPPGERKFAYVTFYDVLNGLMKLPHVDIYVTGSNSKMLSRDIATNFRDRGFEIRLHPLSFEEYYAVSGLEKAEAFDEYLIWGGMPVAVQEKDENVRAAYLKDLFKKVYVKDICERHRLKSDYELDKLVDVLSSSVGSLTNPHKLVNSLKTVMGVKTSDRTLKKYLDYLEESFLFSKAKRYDVKGRRYLEYPEKYYAEDPGLRNARMNFRQSEFSHLMENVIYNELIARGCNVDVGVVDLTSQNGGVVEHRQHEIDFIVNLGVRKVYVQSALELPTPEKREQESLSLRKSGDFFRKIIVTSGSRRPLEGEDGIITVGVIPFLLDRTILTGEAVQS